MWLHKWIKDVRSWPPYGMRYKLYSTTFFVAPLPIFNTSNKRYVIICYTSCIMNTYIHFIVRVEYWESSHEHDCVSECVPHIICWPSPHFMGKQLYKLKLRDHYFLATSSVYKDSLFKTSLS